MDKETLKNKCDLNRIEERTFTSIFQEEYKQDYIIDDKGNAIIPISPLEFKLIETIKDLEERIKVLEEVSVKSG